jgi:hypothetical protein
LSANAGGSDLGISSALFGFDTFVSYNARGDVDRRKGTRILGRSREFGEETFGKGSPTTARSTSRAPLAYLFTTKRKHASDVRRFHCARTNSGAYVESGRLLASRRARRP